jgi:hypothetical protein
LQYIDIPIIIGFFYKYRLLDIEIFDITEYRYFSVLYVSFISHDRSRLTLNPSLLLQVPLCRTTTFKNSYFNRTVHLWNAVCRTASPNSFVTLFTFKNFLCQTYSFLCNSVFDVDMPCTWSLVRDCPTRADFVLDQSAHLFTFSLSANHNAGNEKFTPRQARKYCRLLGLPWDSILTF